MPEPLGVEGLLNPLDDGGKGCRGWSGRGPHRAGNGPAGGLRMVMPATADAAGVLRDVRMRRQLPEQLQAAGTPLRVHREEFGIGPKNGVVELQLSDEEFSGGPLVVRDGSEPGFEQGVVVPDVVFHGIRRAREYGRVHGELVGGSPLQGLDGRRRGNRGRQPDDDVVLAERQEPLDGGNHVQAHRAAEAAVFQQGFLALEGPGPAEDAADDATVLGQVVEDDDGPGVGGGQGLARLLPAQGIEGTNDGEMHGSN
ncbi:hypothetical protein ABFP37_15995 [Burkholderia sp. RS01]|uniref:hypothetical protein n=1 Tax=unclassified Burkholderia TaxID=2613784 RepID=UPI0032181FDD